MPEHLTLRLNNEQFWSRANRELYWRDYCAFSSVKSVDYCGNDKTRKKRAMFNSSSVCAVQTWAIRAKIHAELGSGEYSMILVGRSSKKKTHLLSSRLIMNLVLLLRWWGLVFVRRFSDQMNEVTYSSPRYLDVVSTALSSLRSYCIFLHTDPFNEGLCKLKHMNWAQFFRPSLVFFYTVTRLMKNYTDEQ